MRSILTLCTSSRCIARVPLSLPVQTLAARGKAQVQVIFDTDTFWLSQQRMAELFGVTQQDISYHLQQINDSGELHLSDGYKKYLYGSEKWSDEAMYNLDVVIAVGYRVNSYEATQFRIWATCAGLRAFIVSPSTLTICCKDSDFSGGQVFAFLRVA